jgi:hypothetical protein
MSVEPRPSSNAAGDEQFQLALAKVLEEFDILTAGKANMTIEETIEFREYIRKRTNLEKRDENLTPEQKAWKHVFYSLDEELTKNLGKDDKENLDKLRLQMNQLDLLSKNVDQLFLMGRQIEELLIHQHTYLGVHFDGNRYKENEEKMAADMLAESTPKPRRIEIAREILKMIDQYKQLMLKPLFDDQNKAYDLLTRFSEVYRQTPFSEANGDEGIVKIEKLYGEWLTLTEEVHKARLKAITGVRNLLDLDAFIPNHIIKHNGNKSVNISTEEFANPYVAAEVLLKEGHSKEQEITERRTALSLEAFGNPDSYIKVAQDEPPKETPKKEDLKVNPLQEKAWFRFLKVIYITACVLAGLVSIGILSSGSNDGIVVILGLVVFFFLIRKTFYYVVLGKSTWK